MGIAWEAYHKGVPLFEVAEITLENTFSVGVKAPTFKVVSGGLGVL